MRLEVVFAATGMYFARRIGLGRPVEGARMSITATQAKAPVNCVDGRELASRSKRGSAKLRSADSNEAPPNRVNGFDRPSVAASKRAGSSSRRAAGVLASDGARRHESHRRSSQSRSRAVGSNPARSCRDHPMGTTGIANFEDGRSSFEPDLLATLRQALEYAGLEFVEENGKGPGVRLRKGK